MTFLFNQTNKCLTTVGCKAASQAPKKYYPTLEGGDFFGWLDEEADHCYICMGGGVIAVTNS